jgi:hypothetical protein
MGQVAGNMGNPNITGPTANRAAWGDMDNSEKGARVLSGATQGLAKGFQNYQQQNSQLRRQPNMAPTMPNFYGQGQG